MVGRTPLQRLLGNIGLYGAVFLYVAFALLPIYWTVKISVTPENLLYSEGIRLWPSRVTFANYASVLKATDFPRFFLNSLIVSLVNRADRDGGRLNGRLCPVALPVSRQGMGEPGVAADPDLSPRHGDPADLPHHEPVRADR